MKVHYYVEIVFSSLIASQHRNLSMFVFVLRKSKERKREKKNKTAAPFLIAHK